MPAAWKCCRKWNSLLLLSYFEERMLRHNLIVYRDDLPGNDSAAVR